MKRDGVGNLAPSPFQFLERVYVEPEEIIILAALLLVLYSVTQNMSGPFSTPTTDKNGNPIGPGFLAFAQAIAQAEGYGIAGALPTRNNNPGDMTEDLIGTSTGKDQGKVIFDSPITGWQNLYAQLQLILNGGSAIYETSMNYSDLGEWWVGGAAVTTAEATNWTNNVVASLVNQGYNVSVTDPIGNVLGA